MSNPNLNGVFSPQTIAQSARNGVPISGRKPAPASNSITVARATVGSSSVAVDLTSTGSGSAQLYLWTGLIGAIPVYTTSCSAADDPAPDYGFTPRAVADGGTPPWSPDMSGHVVNHLAAAVTPTTKHLTIPITPAQRSSLLQDGRLLISYQTPNDEVQALDLKLTR